MLILLQHEQAVESYFSLCCTGFPFSSNSSEHRPVLADSPDQAMRGAVYKKSGLQDT